MKKIFNKLIKKKNFAFLLLTIVIVGSIPRSIEIVSGNYLFGFDQGEHFEAVKSIVVDRKLTLIGTEVGGIGGFFQGPLWYYFLAIPFILTQGNPYGAMVLMFIVGILTITFSMTFGKKIFDFPTSLAIGILVAISPAIIAQSRFIWPPFIVSLLSVFVIFFLYRILQREGKFLPLLTFTVGLMFHFEVATGATLLMQLVLISPVFIIKKVASLRYYIFALLSFFSTQISLFLFDLRHDFINTKGIIKLFTSGSSGDHPINRIDVIMNHINVFKSNYLSTFQMNEIIWPILLFALVVGIVLYFKDARITNARKLLIFYLVTSPLTLFIVFILYPSPMWEWWILELMIFYCFLFGAIFAYLFKNKLMRLFVIGIYVILLFSFINKTIFFYKNDFNDFGGTQKIKGKIEAIDYIFQDAKKEPFGLMVFTPPVYTYAYDYLVWWHGLKKYNYVPYKEKKGTFYLLIEPDSSKRWSYKGWLETVIKTGTILKTKELPSGFIVQKRIES